MPSLNFQCSYGPVGIHSYPGRQGRKKCINKKMDLETKFYMFNTGNGRYRT